MKTTKRFLKYAKWCFLIQGLTWIVILVVGFILSPSPTLESILGIFISLYYPTIMLIEKIGHFKGETNITLPILLGVSLGILLYSILFGFIVSYYKEVSRRSSSFKSQE